MSAARGAEGLWILARALWHRSAVMFLRYAFNTLGLLVSLYLVFLVFFLGANYVGGGFAGSPVPGLGRTLDQLVVGFFLWFLALAAYQDLADKVMQEAQWGTLEQVMMTPFGFRWVSLVTVLVDTVLNFAIAAVILAAMLLTSGRTLHVDLATVVPLLLLVVGTSVGLGFGLAGLALIYKRVQALYQVLQFLLIFLIAAPLDASPLLGLLPLTLPAHLTIDAMTQGTRLWQMPVRELALASVVSAAYLALGLLVFGRMERAARATGNLAHY
ncbi:MAG: ABC transporter permease [Clostridia bacterium]|nr:ABC transporter permease [Clostridia bacterium]